MNTGSLMLTVIVAPLEESVMSGEPMMAEEDREECQTVKRELTKLKPKTM